MLLVDLGVPRNIDPAAAGLDGVILYNIDDLQQVVARSTAYRLEEAEKAKSLISGEVLKFAALRRADEVTETSRELCEALKLIGENECRRALGRLDGLTDRERREVALMAHRIVGKILHSPLNALNEEARGRNGAEISRSVRRLFGI